MKALADSPNEHEARSAGQKATRMEEEHPGLKEAAERADSLARTKNGQGPDWEALMAFVKGAYGAFQGVASSVNQVLIGVQLAGQVRLTRATRGRMIYLSILLPTQTLVRAKEMSLFQQQAFKEEVLRRVEEELDELI